jgi:inhibitor of KinA
LTTSNLFKTFPLGDAAIVVKFADSIDPNFYGKVRALKEYLDRKSLTGMLEYVPAYSTLTIYYDSLQRSFHDIDAELRGVIGELSQIPAPNPRIVEIPVCYGGEFGPDLEFVAQHNSLKADEVIQIHSNGDYLVYMIGFAPGFPYLGGMSQQIASPRRDSPRLQIPVGSVGIAGTQTGVYPIETPGGWQLIGRTPIQLFRPREHPPTLLRAGDTVRFRSITTKEYASLRKGSQ